MERKLNLKVGDVVMRCSKDKSCVDVLQITMIRIYKVEEQEECYYFSGQERLKEDEILTIEEYKRLKERRIKNENL